MYSSHLTRWQNEANTLTPSSVHECFLEETRLDLSFGGRWGLGELKWGLGAHHPALRAEGRGWVRPNYMPTPASTFPESQVLIVATSRQQNAGPGLSHSRL